MVSHILGLVIGMGSKIIINVVMSIYSGIGLGTIISVGGKLSGMHRLCLCFCTLIASLPLFYVFSSSPFDAPSEDACSATRCFNGFCHNSIQNANYASIF